MIEGKYLVSGNRLSAANQPLLLEIGDLYWTNYTVEFDYYGLSWSDNIGGVILTVGQKLQISLCTARGGWRALDGTDWLPVGGNVGGVKESGHLKFVVAANKYTIYQNGALFNQMIYGDPLAGPFGLTLMSSAQITNFSVTSP